MKTRKLTFSILALSLVFLSDVGIAAKRGSSKPTPKRKPAAEDVSGYISGKILKDSPTDKVFANFRKGTSPEDQKAYVQRLTQYVNSLQFADPEKTANSLFKSVTQFVMCDDLEDWNCLEAVPIVEPKADYRVEDPTQEYGKPRSAGKSLDIEWWYTKRFYKGKYTNFLKVPPAIQKIAADKIVEYGSEFVWAASYGINDTGVFDSTEADKVEKAALTQRNYNSLISAVQAAAPADKQEEVAQMLRKELEKFSMADFGKVLADLGKKKRAQFVFDFNAQDRKKNKGMFFQYKDSPKFALGLSQAWPGEWPGRIEWSDDGIMHNKFLVMKNNGKYSLWAGTGNFSDTCMGLEVNTNMFLLLRNGAIAKAYLDEFNEMYNFVERDAAENEKIKALIPNDFRVGGLFHKKKRPNTPRYFVFEDGTEVRLNFSPTDDATHRVIIPFLRSSKAGDSIRISMMGNGDVEIVRAIQYALAQGADIQILMDNKGGAQTTSWRLNKGANLTIEANPFVLGGKKAGKLEFRNGDWVGGMHHQKIATRVRGEKAIEMIIGSQNWSDGGNASNDENLMIMRNREKGLAIVEDFNRHFDTDLWPFARTEWTNSANADAEEDPETGVGEAK